MEVQDSCFSGDFGGGATGITSLSSDIIRSHILTKLDGPSLASTSSSSPQLHTICSEQNLWKNICNSAFPSTTYPLVHNTISNFPSGHRSFFSDAFPTLYHHQLKSKSKLKKKALKADSSPELISAVDVRFQDHLAYSKAVATDSRTSWFTSSPFRIDLVGPKDFFPIPMKFLDDEIQMMKKLKEEMKLSWIIIDPTINKAVNLSSQVPVDVRRNRFTGYIEVRYATVMAAAGVEGGFASYVAKVTCEGKEGRELHVMEISMQVENIEGKIMNGKDSLVILHEAMEGRRRAKLEIFEMNKRYENFIEMRRIWRENKERREKRIDIVCMASGVTIFSLFLSLIFFS